VPEPLGLVHHRPDLPVDEAADGGLEVTVVLVELKRDCRGHEAGSQRRPEPTIDGLTNVC